MLLCSGARMASDPAGVIGVPKHSSANSSSIDRAAEPCLSMSSQLHDGSA